MAGGGAKQIWKCWLTTAAVCVEEKGERERWKLEVEIDCQQNTSNIIVMVLIENDNT